jgi:hypothetical protein
MKIRERKPVDGSRSLVAPAMGDYRTMVALRVAATSPFTDSLMK